MRPRSLSALESVLPQGLELRSAMEGAVAGGFGGHPHPNPPSLGSSLSAGALLWSWQRTPPAPPGPLAAPGVLEPAPSAWRRGTPLPSARHRGSPGEPRALFALPSARGPLPAPRWPIECEVIEETIKHIGEGALRPFPAPLTLVPDPCCAHSTRLHPSHRVGAP